MDPLSLVMLAAMVLVGVFMLRSAGGGRTRCTRCDGTGHVSERWPDPKEPTGWHVVEGTCPKCKGKGAV